MGLLWLRSNIDESSFRRRRRRGHSLKGEASIPVEFCRWDNEDEQRRPMHLSRTSVADHEGKEIKKDKGKGPEPKNQHCDLVTSTEPVIKDRSKEEVFERCRESDNTTPSKESVVERLTVQPLRISCHESDELACMSGAVPYPDLIMSGGADWSNSSLGKRRSTSIFAATSESSLSCHVHPALDPGLSTPKPEKDPLMRSIRPRLPDEPEPEYKRVKGYVTRTTHGKMVQGELLDGNFKFRFRVLGDEDEFAVPFEVRIVAERSVKEVKGRTWWRFWGKRTVGKEKKWKLSHEEKRDAFYNLD